MPGGAEVIAWLKSGVSYSQDLIAVTTEDRDPRQPAARLWEALAVLEPTEPGAHSWTDWGKEWFGPDLWALIADVRSAAARVAQERLNPS